MNFSKFIWFYILVSFFQESLSQTPILFEDSFTETLTEQDKFEIYLDSIDKYLYRDIDLTILALEACQKLIDQGAVLSDSILFDYVISQIYVRYSKADPLGAYQIIVDNESKVNDKSLSNKQIGKFNYLRSFTFMSMGDLEAAQKSYYKALEQGKENKDTATIIQNLYSLGQLYNEEGELEESANCFFKIIKLGEVFEIRPTTLGLTYIELGDTYIDWEDYDKALKALKTAYDILDEHEIEVLKSDALLLRGNIYVEKNQIDSASYIYKQLVALNQEMDDQNNIQNADRFLADLYRAKKMYPQALKTYMDIIEEIDSTDFEDIILTYSHVHEVYKEMNDFEAAYDYLLAHNEAKKKIEEDEKRQKTAYLKIKYESEQKEKENAILAAELTQNQAERKILYAWMAVLACFLVFLFGAFYQKRRYSKNLETEVLKRTINLEKSNKLLDKSNQELDEFNRILSHDLKEPLRGIVSFSQLAERNIKDTNKAKEFLNYVSLGGKQLEQLIEDVNLFQQSSAIDAEEITTISIPLLLEDTVLAIRKNYPNKAINLLSNAIDLSIKGSLEILQVVFFNIIDNSAKYNENEVVVIEVSYQLQNQMHYFEIKDNGIGMAPKFHKKIFEMFRRLNSRDAYFGSGLGLSIAQRLIEKIDGEISVLHSQENKGSTFLVRFPKLEN